MDTLIENIDPEKRTLTKEELQNFISESLRQIGQINEAYKKAFEGSEEQTGLFIEIEEKLKQIRGKYEDFFVTPGDDGKTKLLNLDEKIDQIKNYHKKLLEGEDSIKSDIAESQQFITEFYNYLFDSEGENKNRDEQVKKSIEDIIQFNEKVQGEEGYSKTVEKAHSAIMKKYKDLYGVKDESGKNKIEKLDEEIEKISSYSSDVKNRIQPFLEQSRIEIEKRVDEANGLLASATGGSLVQGFLESKNEYKSIPEYKEVKGSSFEKILCVISNTLKFIFSHIGIIVDYILFILPLLISVFIFIQPDVVVNILDIDNDNKSLSEYLGKLSFLGRLTISLPLWWISWFGQRSITHKRRLAEEYNHKAQVTKMYLNFSSRETQGAYSLSVAAKNSLDIELMNVIKRHPGQVFGKDETIFDKVLEAIKAVRGIKNKEEDEQKFEDDSVVDIKDDGGNLEKE